MIQATLHEQLRDLLLKLNGVTLGTRFGGEAFFFRKRFFCHFHPPRNPSFLETFVWNKVNEVTSQIPGTIPHPEYGGYGWVRLPIDSKDGFASGRKLIETTYKYQRTIKRVSVRKDQFRYEILESIRAKFPEVIVRVKEAKKTNQILLETPGLSDYEKADQLLNQATRMLKSIRKRD